MAELDGNYFVCTLGQAAQRHRGQHEQFRTINSFLDRQARTLPDKPAVAFPLPPSAETSDPAWGYRLFTFEDLRRRTVDTGRILARLLPREPVAGETVALLCPSSIDFLLAWLGLITQGCSVLLIAPQCQPAAIAHLCTACNVTAVYYDKLYEALARTATKTAEGSSLPPWVCLPDLSKEQDTSPESTQGSHLGPQDDTSIDESSIAYLHHTSGTSTGVPKPIPQSHRAAVGVLPVFGSGHESPSFTTTPLYHGGVADCFRAWTSGALIWLFPGKHVPITALNVLNCLRVASSAAEAERVPPVKYFSSVPYVLQMLASENDGRKALQQLDTVGVGGAALTQDVGDDLVAKGINLVSRFGSAECGFLMSSHRDYEKDKEWSYLRSHGSPLLGFDHEREDGLRELVVHRQWPHMAKRNTDDGGLATSDLFQAHPSIPDAWKYHSRADSQLTLITGKKFDPAPLEDAIGASPQLAGAFLFGNGQQYPGALLFRSSRTPECSDEQLLRDIWPMVEKLNSESQDHARIARSMLFVMPADSPPLPKSSKGTVLRGEAERTFAETIKHAYEGRMVSEHGKENDDPKEVPPDHEVATQVLDLIKQVVAKPDPIPPDADLFTYGVDSVACIQIRNLLQEQIVGQKTPALPLNVVYDSGNVNRLANFLIRFRKGQSVGSEDEVELMRQVVDEYSDLGVPPNGQDLSDDQANDAAEKMEQSRDTIILTGATGSLGAHILSQLLTLHTNVRVVCLVRGATCQVSEARVARALAQRRLSHDVEALVASHRLQCLPCNLSRPDLGLDKAMYHELIRNNTTIIHAAWAVNFNTRLRSFVKDHIAGLNHLLAFALSCHRLRQFLFCSSTASITCSPGTTLIREIVSSNPQDASPLGYSRSKWVAEQICARACQKHPTLRGQVKVLRVGQLCGDTTHGVWNMSEAWPLMLSASAKTSLGGLPNLGEEQKLDWLPVDRAAEAIVHLLQTRPSSSGQFNGGKADVSVYHILNSNTTVTWDDLLAWVKDLEPGTQIYPPMEWLSRLENTADHPAKRLIGLWKTAFIEDGGPDDFNADESLRRKSIASRFDTTVTKAVLEDSGGAGTMLDQPITRELFGKIDRWIRDQ